MHAHAHAPPGGAALRGAARRFAARRAASAPVAWRDVLRRGASRRIYIYIYIYIYIITYKCKSEFWMFMLHCHFYSQLCFFCLWKKFQSFIFGFQFQNYFWFYEFYIWILFWIHDFHFSKLEKQTYVSFFCFRQNNFWDLFFIYLFFGIYFCWRWCFFVFL